MSNGIQYYYVEAEGNDGNKFILNAYGSEATELYDEVHRCVLCGRTISGTNRNYLITYFASKKRNLFVEPGCISILKKLEIAYGKEFFVG